MTSMSDFIPKYAVDMKIENSIIDDRERLNLLENLRKISEWFERWEMPFIVNKYHILQVGTRNQKFDYEINSVKTDSIQCIKKTLVL